MRTGVKGFGGNVKLPKLQWLCHTKADKSENKID
jgi:hypothetical protein